jgi:hypothetical protein
MKTNTHFLSYLSFLLRMRKGSKKIVKKIKTHILSSVAFFFFFFFENHAVYEIAGQTTDENTAQSALHAGYLRLQT